MATALVLLVSTLVTSAPSVTLAQALDGRTASPLERRISQADVQELRQLVGVRTGERDAARSSAASERWRATVAAADLNRVSAIFGLPAETAPALVLQTLERWVLQDEANRKELARLNDVVAQIENGAARSAAELYIEEAQTAFDDGRLEDADRALGRLEALRDAAQGDARNLWVDAILTRSALADQRLDGPLARSLAREARLAERDRSNRDQWQLAMREAQSFELEDPRRRDNEALKAAVLIYRDEALPLVPRSRAPLDWAVTQNSLGEAAWRLGEREPDSVRLKEAVVAFRAALKEYTRELHPLDWATAQSNLGVALMRLGTRDSGVERLEEAVVAYRSALQVYDRGRSPRE